MLIKRLDDAIKAGDPVHAVIRSSACNHGGRSDGITMPNGVAHRKLLWAAHQAAGLDPSDTPVVEVSIFFFFFGSPTSGNIHYPVVCQYSFLTSAFTSLGPRNRHSRWVSTLCQVPCPVASLTRVHAQRPHRSWCFHSCAGQEQDSREPDLHRFRQVQLRASSCAFALNTCCDVMTNLY